VSIASSKNGKLIPHPELSSAQVKDLHELVHDAGPYSQLIGQLPDTMDPGGILTGSAGTYIDEYLREMAPRNPGERMLAVQMLLQHARVSRLMSMTPNTETKAFASFQAALDSALNTYRRQMATWDAIRLPRPVQFIRGAQVNLARQQVISQGSDSSFNRANQTNEQGCRDASEAPLLPERLGQDVSAILRPQEPAVDEGNRAPHAAGEGPIGPKRSNTRRTRG
jgi:hypothetical protein